jgi:non-ribosomal peptide synthase protein (TIGR01720 family)
LLIKAAIFKEGNSDLLFITAHHLIIDGISWRVLMEDFHSIYTSLEKGKEIKLHQKTASLVDWNKKLLEFSNSVELKNQLKYWKQEVHNQNILPPDSCLPSSRVKDIQKESFQLTEEETKFFLADANKPYNTNIEILMVTALVKALEEWRNVDDIVIEMESHGRHLEDVDSARTVGWFTSMFPVKFDCPDGNLGEQIKYVKEKIRKVPDVDLGYGILKYLSKSLSENCELAEVRFNYLGQFENELNNDLFSYEKVDIGSEMDLENHFTARIEVNAMVINNELHVEFNSTEISDNSFMDAYQNNFKSILSHLKDEDEIYFTPSDFDAVELDEEDLKMLFG